MWAKRLKDCRPRIFAPKPRCHTDLQGAEQRVACHEEKVSECSTRLGTDKREKVSDQVEHLAASRLELREQSQEDTHQQQQPEAEKQS